MSWLDNLLRFGAATSTTGILIQGLQTVALSDYARIGAGKFNPVPYVGGNFKFRISLYSSVAKSAYIQLWDRDTNTLLATGSNSTAVDKTLLATYDSTALSLVAAEHTYEVRAKLDSAVAGDAMFIALAQIVVY